MEAQMSKIMALAGDAHCYQYLIVFICFLIWSITPIFSNILCFLENNPFISYYDAAKNETVVESLSYVTCTWPNNYTIVETYSYSWVIEIGISCEKLMVSILGTVSSFGLLLGAAFASVLTRAFGQRRVMLITNCVFIISLLVNLFVIHYAYFAFVICLCQLCSNILCYSVNILFSEIVSPQKKAVLAALITSGLGLGGVIFIFLFYVCQNWKYVHIVTMVIMLIMTVLIQIFFVDSPKRMLEMRDINNFLKSVRFIAKINGRLELFNQKILEEEYQNILRSLGGENEIQLKAIDQVSDSSKSVHQNALSNDSNAVNLEKPKEGEIPVSTPTTQPMKISDNLRKVETTVFSSPQKEAKGVLLKVTPWCLLKYKSVRGTFLLFCLLWFCTSCLYSGLAIGVKSLPGSIYVNGLMLYCGETVGYFVSGPLMNVKRFGRKYSLMIFTGGFSACCFFMVGLIDYQIPCAVFYVLTRFCAMSAFCIYYTYCLESYPSSIRGLAYGINGACNSIGGMMIPFIIEYLSRRMLYLVYAIFGLGCAILMLCLRETIGQPIPNNIKEMEEELEAKKMKNIPVVVV